MNNRNNSKVDTFSLDEGFAILQWPADMSEESLLMFEEWMKINMRKIRRSTLLSIAQQEELNN